MKKIIMASLVTVLALASFAMAADTQTATQPTTANAEIEKQAKEFCTKKGLAGAMFDECVKTEIAKLTAAKAK